ncbi:hypothetical protein SynROS8604_01825 [Synechococcus sp. ROS8604]|nr:hypothetical protein SynROS8604_01825 [Synechococcus sp. ROS8604]
MDVLTTISDPACFLMRIFKRACLQVEFINGSRTDFEFS